jgi:uncharacterized protein (DUF2141 family)
MKRRTVILLVLVGVGACAGSKLLLDKGPGTGSLEVEILGIKGGEGQLRVAVFGTPDGFPGDPEKAEQVAIFPVEGESMVWQSEELHTGLWAVAVLHDENSNGAMETDWLGRPSEGWGVSNDAKGSFGPPSFDDAAVELTVKDTRIQITLRY